MRLGSVWQYKFKITCLSQARSNELDSIKNGNLKEWLMYWDSYNKQICGTKCNTWFKLNESILYLT